MDGLADFRDPKRIVYPARSLVWSGLILFISRLGSRRRLRFELCSQAGIENLNLLAGTGVSLPPHSDTLAYFLKGLPPAELSELRSGMIQDLLRSRALEKFRLLGQYYTAAADGTGVLTFHKHHCQHCLTQVHEGKTVYYHTVLELKLVFPNGLALSVATEFIENTDGKPCRRGLNPSGAAAQNVVAALRISVTWCAPRPLPAPPRTFTGNSRHRLRRS